MIPLTALNYAKSTLIEKLSEMRTASKISQEHLKGYLDAKKAPESVLLAFDELSKCCDHNLTKYTTLITSLVEEIEKHDTLMRENKELRKMIGDVVDVAKKKIFA